MFWQDTKGLKTIPTGYKLGLSLFLVLAGIGYLLGFVKIYQTYSPVDQKPGLSIKDVQLSFYGTRETTVLEQSLKGSMAKYLASESDGQKIVDWINRGAKEFDFDTIKPILDYSCWECHSASENAANVITDTYADVASLLVQDTGKSWSRIVSISHTHLPALLTLVFLLCFVFSFTEFSIKFKGSIIVFAFSSLFLDIGSWSLAKLSPVFAVLVLIGGMSLALSFAALILLPLFDMWFRKAKK